MNFTPIIADGGHGDAKAIAEGRLSGLRQPMIASEPKPILFGKGLEEVTYICESCGTTTVRTIKA